MLLVTLHLFAELGALEMLRFPTFTTAIYDQFQSTFNSPAANMLASVLVTGCLLALLAELTLRGRGAICPGRGWCAPSGRAGPTWRRHASGAGPVDAAERPGAWACRW